MTMPDWPEMKDPIVNATLPSKTDHAALQRIVNFVVQLRAKPIGDSELVSKHGMRDLMSSQDPIDF